MEQIVFILSLLVIIYIAIPMILFLIYTCLGILSEIFNNEDIKDIQESIFTKKLYDFLVKLYPFLR
uniref:Uncharacterized protein n=1 Tax=virus sp. ctd0M1 TaxID=2827993 RepID=A0A8S5REA6_9VIRU|nr:MAG TPA: hypothetical protein [virus sp. ctd0M1]